MRQETFTWRRLMLVFVCATASTAATACDICGCGAGNFFLGSQPMVRRHFVGLTVRSIRFRSWYDRQDGRLHSMEHFRTLEWQGRWLPHRRWQVQARLPIGFNRQLMDGQVKSLQGLGDAAVLAQYNLLDKLGLLADKKRSVQQQWWVGGGMKLPTGRYDYSPDPAEVANPNFQLGSGSTDALLTTQYSMRINRVGLMADAVWRRNGSNSNGYRFGHRWQTNLSVYTVQKWKQTGLQAYAGMGVDWMQADDNNGTKNEYTGGYVAAAQAGVDVFVGNCWIGGLVRIPVGQRQGGGVLDQQINASLQFNFLLGATR